VQKFDVLIASVVLILSGARTMKSQAVTQRICGPGAFLIGVVGLLLTFCPIPAPAQMAVLDKEVVERPEWSVGDWWEFKGADRAWRATVWRKDENGYVLVKSALGEAIRTREGQEKAHVNRDGRLLRIVDADGKVQEADNEIEWSRFPLNVGKRWFFDSPWKTVTGEPAIFSFDCKVEGWETIEIGGRKIRVLKIVYSSRRRSYSPTFSNSHFGWYAPEAKRLVRLTSYYRGGPNLEVTAWHIRSVAAPPAVAVAPPSLDLPKRSGSKDLPARLRSLSGAAWALVIGINAYREADHLNYAVTDAQAVAAALPALGFQGMRVLLDADATKANIERAIYSELKDRMGPQDRLFVFFAGHGITVKLPKGGEEGYLVPVDGDPRQPELTAIPMDEIRTMGKRVSAKHIFFAIDACFSGFAATRDIRVQGPTDMEIASALEEPVVQVLTAGRKGQKAIEDGGHGLFTRRLLEGLSGFADRDQRGFITVTQLAAWLSPRVIRDSGGRQHPQYSALDGEGDFVFLLPQLRK
jgi:hypothetical protein